MYPGVPWCFRGLSHASQGERAAMMSGLVMWIRAACMVGGFGEGVGCWTVKRIDGLVGWVDSLIDWVSGWILRPAVGHIKRWIDR